VKLSLHLLKLQHEIMCVVYRERQTTSCKFRKFFLGGTGNRTHFVHAAGHLRKDRQ